MHMSGPCVLSKLAELHTCCFKARGPTSVCVRLSCASAADLGSMLTLSNAA